MRAIRSVTLAVSALIIGGGAVFAAAMRTPPRPPMLLQQIPSASQPSNPSKFPDPLHKNEPPDPMRDRMEEQNAKARNSERFKRIQADTDKLLKLSTELKEDVDKTTKNEMSLDVIKKAAEIEKLAHDVKERMKG